MTDQTATRESSSTTGTHIKSWLQLQFINSLSARWILWLANGNYTVSYAVYASMLRAVPNTSDTQQKPKTFWTFRSPYIMVTHQVLYRVTLIHSLKIIKGTLNSANSCLFLGLCNVPEFIDNYLLWFILLYLYNLKCSLLYTEHHFYLNEKHFKMWIV